ncbi:unnamed protein product [Moneuplotes crassus]|uniref:Cyclin-dependent kinase 2 homolog n=2 Tax=Euplotes crassus TaxID=5936 RepID=A0AAD1XM73_EUPCR|nr:unnamed protein product [Moneuplotes crassus]
MQQFGYNPPTAYKRLNEVGDGTYGVVYKAENTQTGDIVALKKIKLDVQNEGIPSTAIREIALLREIEHENIVQLLDVVSTETQLQLIFQYMDRDLKEFIEQKKTSGNKIDNLTIKSIMCQILRGVADCHAKRILHRDIKPQNILLNDEGEVKIADFGLARAFQVPIRPYTHEVVTLYYRAPEILLSSVEYSTAVDIWSVGLVFAELYNQTPLLQGDSEIDQIFKVFSLLGHPTEEEWPGVTEMKNYKKTFPQWKPQNLAERVPGMDELGIDLLSKMLALDPAKRISADAALSHPFFDDLNQLIEEQNAEFGS